MAALVLQDNDTFRLGPDIKRMSPTRVVAVAYRGALEISMTGIPRGNLLLNGLAPDALAALEIREEDHPIGAVLVTQDETPDSIFFPYAGAVISIVRSTESGAMVEAGVIGGEGMFVVQTVLAAAAPTGSEAVVQTEGRFARVGRRRLHDLFRANEPFHDALLAFTGLFLEQVTQNLVCNRLHAIEQRLAKWLLVVRDRIDTDHLHLTQEFIAHMLGIHRPGVTIAVAALEVDGLIQHGRNMIEIRDREGLLNRSCECYGVVHRKLQQFRSACIGSESYRQAVVRAVSCSGGSD